jgi:hypothetical protein
MDPPACDVSGCDIGRRCDGELSREGHQYCNRVDPQCSIPKPAVAGRPRREACSQVIDPVCGCGGVTHEGVLPPGGRGDTAFRRHLSLIIRSEY